MEHRLQYCRNTSHVEYAIKIFECNQVLNDICYTFAREQTNEFIAKMVCIANANQLAKHVHPIYYGMY